MKPYFAFQWHITDTCDQRCKHCYVFAEDNRKKLTEMPFDKMEKVLESINDMCERLGRTPYIYITGGDPILHIDFWRLAEKLKENNIRWAILGNPFHLDDDVCRKLHDHGCVKYQLSLDGMRETHDMFRKPGSFDTTIEKIDCIRNSGMFCAVMSTVSSANIDEFPQLIDLCAEKTLMFSHSEDTAPQAVRNRRNITFRRRNTVNLWICVIKNLPSIRRAAAKRLFS